MKRFTVIAMEKATRLQLSRKTISRLEDSQLSLGVGIKSSPIFNSWLNFAAINFMFYCVHAIFKDFVASKHRSYLLPEEQEHIR